MEGFFSEVRAGNCSVCLGMNGILGLLDVSLDL